MTKEEFYFALVKETKRRYGYRVVDSQIWYDNLTGIFDGFYGYMIGVRNHKVCYFQAWEELDGHVTIIPDIEKTKQEVQNVHVY